MKTLLICYLIYTFLFTLYMVYMVRKLNKSINRNENVKYIHYLKDADKTR